MRRKDALERYEQTEAQDLIRLFQAVRPPAEAQSPQDFRAKVLAQVEQRHTRHGLFGRMIPLLTPWWAPALAVMLLLSLGVNVWTGFWTFGQHPRDSPQAAGP